MMSKEILNLIFVIITLVSVGLVFLVSFLIKKGINNYWFWCISSLFFLSYFITFRFYEDWSSFATYLQENGSIWLKQTSSYSESIIVSKALVLDLCPFVALFLPLTLIFDKSRRIAQAVAPFAILGGAITIPFIASVDLSAELTWEYLFVGNSPNAIYFLMHWYLVVFGTLVLVNSINRKWINLLDIHLFAIVFFGYVCFISYTTNTQWNVTGISKNDWENIGEYSLVQTILNLNWPNVMVVSFLLAYIFIVLITAINIGLKKKKRIKKKQIKI